MSGRIPDEIVEKAGIEYLLHMPTGSAIEKEPLRAAIAAVLPDLQQPQTREPHEIDKAFDRLAAKYEQLIQSALAERSTFKAMLEKFADDGSPVQRELADAMLERDAMREANAAGDADGLPLAQTVGYWQDKALDYATTSDHLRVEWKQAEAERDARPDLTPEEQAVIIQDLDYSIEQWADNHDGYDGVRGLYARESARAKLEVLR